VRRTRFSKPQPDGSTQRLVPLELIERLAALVPLLPENPSRTREQSGRGSEPDGRHDEEIDRHQIRDVSRQCAVCPTADSLTTFSE
jgi:hypothetical protein